MVNVEDWEIHFFDTVSSTNDVIKKYCRAGDKRIAVIAKKQTAGRGRRGRSWVSRSGNLFFSLALEFDCRQIGKLVLLCGLSLLQAVKKLNPAADAVLKWPNDVLLNGGKVSGMLLEKGEGNYIICGIGVNTDISPQVEDAIYQVTSLASSTCGLISVFTDISPQVEDASEVT